MVKKRKIATFVLTLTIFGSMVLGVSAQNIKLGWVESYYTNKYPTDEGNNILSYSYDEENKTVLVNIRKKGMNENTYATDVGLYDETNLTVKNLKWARSYFSKKYPRSEGYIIHSYNFDNVTNIAKVELSNKRSTELIKDQIKCSVVINGKAYIEESDNSTIGS